MGGVNYPPIHNHKDQTMDIIEELKKQIEEQKAKKDPTHPDNKFIREGYLLIRKRDCKELEAIVAGGDKSKLGGVLCIINSFLMTPLVDWNYLHQAKVDIVKRRYPSTQNWLVLKKQGKVRAQVEIPFDVGDAAMTSVKGIGENKGLYILQLRDTELVG